MSSSHISSMYHLIGGNRERERELVQSFMESFFPIESRWKIRIRSLLCRSISVWVYVDALSRITHCVALYIWLCRHWFEHQPHCTTHSTVYICQYISFVYNKRRIKEMFCTCTYILNACMFNCLFCVRRTRSSMKRRLFIFIFIDLLTLLFLTSNVHMYIQ